MLAAAAILDQEDDAVKVEALAPAVELVWAVLGELEPLVAQTPSPWFQAGMRYARPLLADDQDAEPPIGGPGSGQGRRAGCQPRMAFPAPPALGSS